MKKFLCIIHIDFLEFLVAKFNLNFHYILKHKIYTIFWAKMDMFTQKYNKLVMKINSH